MDSLTQIALGASVSLVAMGRRTAAWKAALWGGIAGTLPDLDTFWDHGNAVANMVLHRGNSHALLYLSLLSLPLGAAVAALHGERALWRRWWLALWLALFTHPLLDWMTVYGTQLLRPFSHAPYGLGSIFIIDPLYTLPLLVGALAAVLRPGPGLRWAQAGLVLSSGYLVWSVAAQQHVGQLAQRSLQQQGMVHDRLLVTPTPFNTVLWRLVAMGPTHYHEAFYSLLDASPTVHWQAYPRGAALQAPYGALPPVQQVAAFSQGFYRLQQQDGRLAVTDLRMGQEPAYSFHFDLGPLAALDQGQPPAITQQWQRPDLATALPALWRRLRGQDADASPFQALATPSQPTPQP